MAETTDYTDSTDGQGIDGCPATVNNQCYPSRPLGESGSVVPPVRIRRGGNILVFQRKNSGLTFNSFSRIIRAKSGWIYEEGKDHAAD